jgi:GT2 family glycosyltransferase
MNDYPRTHVIVLDCQSQDGSVPAIRGSFPQAEIIELSQNLGYAGNNNVGIERARALGADWVWILNEDVSLHPNCLWQLVTAGESDDRIGIVGPTVFHDNDPTVIQSAGAGLTTWWEGFHYGENEENHGQFSSVRAVDWVTGCAILVRRSVIDAVGALDARFFIYWEETEWCVRAARAGWEIVHAPSAQVWHKGVRRDYVPAPPVFYYLTRNRLLTLAIHHAPFGAWAVAWAQILRTLTSWTIRRKWKHRRADRNAMWQGVADFCRGRVGQMPS